MEPLSQLNSSCVCLKKSEEIYLHHLGTKNSKFEKLNKKTTKIENLENVNEKTKK